jgi:hypothetical protein
MTNYDMSRTPSPCFLFSSQFETFWEGDFGQSPRVPVMTDTGRLLAEFALVVSVTGIVYLLQTEKKK